MEHAAPLAIVTLAWWLSTGAILWLDGLPRATFRWSLIAATLLACFALWGFQAAAWRADEAGAYLGFFCALAIWGWHELSFLMGFLTGPRRTPCPPGAMGWRRFQAAAETVLHHEAALALTAALLVAISWGAPNQVGAAAFLVLFGMRLLAKLNIFLGVPNITEEFLPPSMDYLKSYFRRATPGRFFFLSVVIATSLAAFLGNIAFSSAFGSVERLGGALLFALVALALLEHAMMALPIPDVALWRWALSSHRAKRS